jgi:CheY-like chemotaxis protein
MDKDPSILLVDDDNTIREMLVPVFRRMGYEVFSASSGMEAFDILESNPHIDMILLDVIMPEMNGFDVLREVKGDSRYKDILVIMVTGINLIHEKELAFSLGACDYLPKPFDRRELEARVKTHLNLKKSLEKIVHQKKILETILSTVPGIVYLKDKNGTYVHGNNQFTKFLTFPNSDVAGKTDVDLFSPQIAEDREKMDQLLLSYGIPEIEYQEELTSSDNITKSFFTKKKPVLNSEQDVIGLVAVSIDTTEQYILKQACCEKEELLSAVLNAHCDEVLVIDQNKQILMQNNRHYNRYGNIIGKYTSDESFSPNVREELFSGLDEVLKGLTRLTEFDREESGKTVNYVRMIAPVLSDSEIIGAVSMCLDISRWAGYKGEYKNISGVFQNLLDFLKESVILVEIGSDIIVFVNKSASDTYCLASGMHYHPPEPGSRIIPDVVSSSDSDINMGGSLDLNTINVLQISETFRFNEKQVRIIVLEPKDLTGFCEGTPDQKNTRNQ